MSSMKQRSEDDVAVRDRLTRYKDALEDVSNIEEGGLRDEMEQGAFRWALRQLTDLCDDARAEGPRPRSD